MKRFRNISAITAIVSTASFFLPLTTLTMQHSSQALTPYVTAKRLNGDTALHIAAGTWDTDFITLLIDNKADINALNNHNKTPLRVAIEATIQDSAMLLLKRGASIAESDRSLTPKQLPLIHLAVDYALEKNDMKIVTALLQHKADVNTRDDHQNTPLHIAARKEHNKKLLSLLLANNADINAQNDKKRTPLHEATWAATEADRIDNILMLLQHKADIDIKSEHGITAFDIAMQLGNTKLIRILLEKQLARAKALTHESAETAEIKEATEEQNAHGHRRKANCCSAFQNLLAKAYSLCFEKPTTQHHKSA